MAEDLNSASINCLRPLVQRKHGKAWFWDLFFSIAVAVLCQSTFMGSLSLVQALVVAFVVVLLAQLSDLSESLFKRNVRVKDSGTILPGHGGILDRFDSFLLSTPIYYYILVLFL